MDICNIDIIRYIATKLSLNDILSFIIVNKKVYHSLNLDDFWKLYVNQYYRIPYEWFLINYNGKDMSLLCYKILNNIYELGSIVSVYSFVNIFNPDFIHKLALKKLPKRVNPYKDIGEKLYKYIFECEGVLENAIVNIASTYDQNVIMNTDRETFNKFQDYTCIDIHELHKSSNDTLIFLQIFVHLFNKPTEYFTRDGNIILPLNDNVLNMSFINKYGDILLPSDNPHFDEYENGLIIDRDVVCGATIVILNKYYVSNCSSLLNHKYLISPRAPDKLEKEFIDFLQQPFKSNPYIVHLISTFTYQYQCWNSI